MPQSAPQTSDIIELTDSEEDQETMPCNSAPIDSNHIQIILELTDSEEDTTSNKERRHNTRHIRKKSIQQDDVLELTDSEEEISPRSGSLTEEPGELPWRDLLKMLLIKLNRTYSSQPRP